MLKVFCGPMFAGKTTSLFRELGKAKEKNQPIFLFKPVLDTRFKEAVVRTHDGVENPSIWSDLSGSEMAEVPKGSFVGIDEIQFFDYSLIAVLKTLLVKGCTVVVVGLDLTFDGNSFGIMPHVLSLATEVVKLKAVCSCCGGLATRTYRKESITKQVFLLGGSESYEARCIPCWHSKGN